MSADAQFPKCGGGGWAGKGAGAVRRQQQQWMVTPCVPSKATPGGAVPCPAAWSAVREQPAPAGCPSPPYHRGACHHSGEGIQQITPRASIQAVSKGARCRVPRPGETHITNSVRVSYLITETKRHRKRLFCLKNVLATCKCVFRSNFITNCPIGQRLGNYGRPCSSLKDQDTVGVAGGNLSQRAGVEKG